MLDRLREAAEQHQLTYAPDPATHSRCTLGGMLGNNSCGVHGLLGGKAVDNVESLDIVLYDGTRMTVGATAPEELEAIIRAGGRRGEIYAGLKRLRDYNPYNETDLEAPFEFNFSGHPWETQRVVRRVLNENYTAAPDGIPGNDDCGEMSSWAVLSMMGIYSIDPASLAYELTGPVFPKVVIHLHEPYAGKTFIIEAAGAAKMRHISRARRSTAARTARIGFRSTTLPPAARCISCSARNPTRHGAPRPATRRLR